MINRLSLWAGLFIAGYVFGSEGIPKGMKLLLVMGLTLSFCLGLFMSRILDKIKRGAREKLKRFVLESNERPAAAFPEEVKSVNTIQSAVCEFCQGEKEIRIAGTKDIIPCPKCNVQKNTG